MGPVSESQLLHWASLPRWTICWTFSEPEGKPAPKTYFLRPVPGYQVSPVPSAHNLSMPTGSRATRPPLSTLTSHTLHHIFTQVQLFLRKLSAQNSARHIAGALQTCVGPWPRGWEIMVHWQQGGDSSPTHKLPFSGGES